MHRERENIFTTIWVSGKCHGAGWRFVEYCSQLFCFKKGTCKHIHVYMLLIYDCDQCVYIHFDGHVFLRLVMNWRFKKLVACKSSYSNIVRLNICADAPGISLKRPSHLKCSMFTALQHKTNMAIQDQSFLICSLKSGTRRLTLVLWNIIWSEHINFPVSKHILIDYFGL